MQDDNRLLTLPSNERIRLLPHMKVRCTGSACTASFVAQQQLVAGFTELRCL